MMTRSRKKETKTLVSISEQDAADILRACLSPACFWPLEQLNPLSAWLEHGPFAFWLIEALRPQTLVELGTHHGYSYFAFCQAVEQLQLETRCYAIDTWKGDENTGLYGEEVYQQVRRYHDRLYSAFSTLIRSTFAEALPHFSDGTVDLLHIDGCHLYQQVKSDFMQWRPKLSDESVVLFHDTNVHRGDFGVFKLWEELRATYPHFEFLHGCGLGVLGVGQKLPNTIRELFAAAGNEQATSHIRNAYSQLGSTVSLQLASRQQADKLACQTVEVDTLRNLAAKKSEEAVALHGELVATRNRVTELEDKLQVQAAAAEAQRQEGLRAGAIIAAALAEHALLDAILDSTTWRATRPLRMVGGMLPISIRRFVRRLLLGEWSKARSSRAIPTPSQVGESLQHVNALTGSTNSLYESWVRQYDTLSDDDRYAIRRHLACLEQKPLISIIMPVYNCPERLLREAIGSVRAQLYTHWELCIADDASSSAYLGDLLREFSAADPRIKWVRREKNGHISAATNSALKLASGTFIALMDHDDIISEHALYEVVVEINNSPNADLIYSDQDVLAPDGRRSLPYFKTDWNLDLFLAHNIISHFGVYRRSLVEQVGGMREGFEGSQDYDLALRVADATSPDRIRHIPAILYHWRRGHGSASFSEAEMARCVDSAQRAIKDHLIRRGEIATVLSHPSLPNWQRVCRSVPTPAPLVSLIVPTRDKAELLGPCLNGLLSRTNYPNLEVIVVDHESREEATADLLARVSRDVRVRVLRYTGRFNYSAINNAAVAEAHGDIIGLINNDVNVIESNWLSEMVSFAVLPEVGAVGAKLLFPDGRVQHMGVVLGLGGAAGHLLYLAPRNEAGYFGRGLLVSDVSAVTAACLVVRKSVFGEVGGFDEDNLPIAYNDVDLCMKIRKKGYRNVCTPHAELYHVESASRELDTAPSNANRLRADAEYINRKWGAWIKCDPFYNTNLSLSASFEFAFPPRRDKPWRPYQSLREELYA